MKNIIDGESVKCPIQPADIDIGRHFHDAFGHSETEVSAGYLVRLAQVKGGWVPFTKEEIEAFYQKSGHHDFWFNRLITDGWIVERDGKHFFTVQFVARVYLSSPKI
jgi:hypothetical protein